MTNLTPPSNQVPHQQLPMLKRPGLILLILALLFGVPLFGAFLMIKEQTPLSIHTTNHGLLIQPPLDLTLLNLHHANGQLVTPHTWKGKWLLLYVNPQPTCEAQCEEKLYYLRQIKTATGKNSDRVERAILTFSHHSADSQLQKLLNTEFVGTLYFTVPKDDFTNFVYTNMEAKLALTEGSIYLVDPLGNVMMIYRNNIVPMGILKDLTRLLKLSHIG